LNSSRKPNSYTSNFNQNFDWKGNPNQFSGWKQEVGHAQRQSQQASYQGHQFFQQDK